MSIGNNYIRSSYREKCCLLIMDTGKKKIEVCFSPALYPFYRNDNAVVVVSDILRATTAICAAFENGVKSLIPVADLNEAREWKKKGYLVAAERDGLVLDFADFGNSPFNFHPEQVRGKTIVYSTTNGTQAIRMASGAKHVAIGAFINLTALAEWIIGEDSDVLVLCAGWKNRYNIEDSVFAGALFQDCDFSGSDILHSNFIGIEACACCFNDTDLYYTNFTSSSLKDVTYIDCNLKKTDYCHSNRENVNFKYSNYEEATFQRESNI